MIEVSGVRSSWETDATNSSLTRSARMNSVTSLYASAAPAKVPSLPRTERAETDSARRDSGSSPTQIRQSSNSSPWEARYVGISSRVSSVVPSGAYTWPSCPALPRARRGRPAA